MSVLSVPLLALRWPPVHRGPESRVQGKAEGGGQQRHCRVTACAPSAVPEVLFTVNVLFSSLLKTNSKTLAVDEVLLVEHNSTLLTDEIICDKDIFDRAESREKKGQQIRCCVAGKNQNVRSRNCREEQTEIFNDNVVQEEPKEASQLLIAAVINMN